MNQIAYFTIEADINGKPYRLSLPMGTAWAEAISAVEEIVSKVKEIADIAQKNHEESQKAAEATPVPEQEAPDVSKE